MEDIIKLTSNAWEEHCKASKERAIEPNEKILKEFLKLKKGKIKVAKISNLLNDQIDKGIEQQMELWRKVEYMYNLQGKSLTFDTKTNKIIILSLKK